jgi:hypothetical protein
MKIYFWISMFTGSRTESLSEVLNAGAPYTLLLTYQAILLTCFRFSLVSGCPGFKYHPSHRSSSTTPRRLCSYSLFTSQFVQLVYLTAPTLFSNRGWQLMRRTGEYLIGKDLK